MCQEFIETNIDYNLIYDVGMHTGEDTDFYLKKGFNVIAIEAIKELCEENEIKFKKYIEENKLKIINCAINFTEGEYFFYKNKQTQFSSLIESIGTRQGDYEIQKINCVSISKIFTQFGLPYYLKVDIEGKDKTAIFPLENFKNKPKYISFEGGSEDVLNFLNKINYKLFKLIDQSKYSSWKCPKDSLEGNYVNYKFILGSSGLFGEETEGSWLNIDEIKNKIYLAKNNNGNWIDVHAKLC